MITLQMKNPASVAALNGVEIENIDRIRTGEHTAMVAFNKGFEAYPFLFETGEHAARLWLTGKTRMSLAAFRENRWKAFTSGLYPFSHKERQAFDDGFERALAEHIAGGAK